MTPVERLSRLRVAAEILLWRHGWSLPAAVVLCFVALSLHLGMLPPARARLAVARAELSRAVTQPPSEADSATTTDQAQVQSLQDALRGRSDPAALIRKLATLARDANITLTQSEYQQQLHSSVHVVQIQVTQPVRASYPQLKRYIESVLLAMPNASLDQIAARRESVRQSELEVRLVWSLWIHAPSLEPTAVALRQESP